MAIDYNKRWLVISDTQEPFGARHSITFIREVKRFFGILDENMMHAGDELDCLTGGMYPKDPDGDFTPKGEIHAGQERMKEYYDAFPLMNLAVSNHGLRWIKKATAAEIPSQLMRSYREIFKFPEGWQWREEWIIKAKYSWRLIHGMGYSGKDGARNATIDAGISTVIGHLHSHAGVNYIQTQGRADMIWAMNVGCLIDPESYAFKYGKYSRFKGCRGIGVILDDGRMPVWVPYPYD